MTVTRKEIKNSNSHIYLTNNDFKGDHPYSEQTYRLVVEGGLSICKVCNAGEIQTLQYSCNEYKEMQNEKI